MGFEPTTNFNNKWPQWFGGWYVLDKRRSKLCTILSKIWTHKPISTTKQQQWLGGWHVWQHNTQKKVVRFAHYFLVRFEPTTSCQNNKQTNKQQQQKMGFEVGSLKNPRGWLAFLLACLCNKCDCSATKVLALLVIDCCLWRVVVVVGCSHRTWYSGQIWICKNGPNHPSIHQSINPHAHPICQKK